MANDRFYIERVVDDWPEIVSSVKDFESAVDIACDEIFLKGEDALAILVGDADGPDETVARVESAQVAENDEAHRVGAQVVLSLDVPAAVPREFVELATGNETYETWVPDSRGQDDTTITVYTQLGRPLGDDAATRYQMLELVPRRRPGVIRDELEDRDDPSVKRFSLMELDDLNTNPRRKGKRRRGALTKKGERYYRAIVDRETLAADAKRRGAADTARRAVVRAAQRGVPGLVRKRNPGDRDDVIAGVVRDATLRTPPWSARSGKRFISDVYETVVAQGRDDGMSLDEFKRELVRLHQAGLVTLARADLVAAMPPRKVEASEVTRQGATFHFVEVRENPPRVYRAQKVVAQLERGAAPEFPAKGMVVSSPDDLVRNTLADYLGERAHESFLVIFIDVRNRVIGYSEYTGGGIASVEVHVSGIMREALACGAAGMVTVHNHPTGVPEPSNDDRALWRRIKAAGELLGVSVVDNLVVGEGGRYFSESEGGRL